MYLMVTIVHMWLSTKQMVACKDCLTEKMKAIDTSVGISYVNLVEFISICTLP